MKDGTITASLKLNLGAGHPDTWLDGYDNLDGQRGDSIYPLTRYADNSAEVIRCSHTLEHFSLAEIPAILKEWVRVLKPGGILKLAVPNFRWICEAYLGQRECPPNAPIASFLMGGQQHASDYHKSIFDEYNLRLLMSDAGLIEIEPWQSELKNDCASLPVSLNLMARKPQPQSAPKPIEIETVPYSYDIPDDMPLEPKYQGFVESIAPLNQYSQFGEDGIIEAIFNAIKFKNAFCFEAGAADGLFFSNTRRLIENGCGALLMEPDEKLFHSLKQRYPDQGSGVILINHALTRDYSVDAALSLVDAPIDIDLLSLDIDGQEYHILNAMVKYKPRVIVAEYAPDADPMFIPEPNGDGQAGRLALRFVLEARGYEIICRTYCNLIAVRKDEAKKLENWPVKGEEIRENKEPGRQFISGQWHDNGLIAEQKKVVVAMVMSRPRYGSLYANDVLGAIAVMLRAPLLTSGGAWWEQGLTRSIKSALQYKDQKGDETDVILTADYDTIGTADDVYEMIKLLYQNPQYDCIVPVQARRGTFEEVLCGTAGPVDLTQGLVPITTGHFGLTVFRRRVFEKLRKPWFLNVPDKDGDWVEHTDADIYFWRNFCDQGFKAALAVNVCIGHEDSHVLYPHIENGKVTKRCMSIFEWLEKRKIPHWSEQPAEIQLISS